ncbi:capsular biosynthesis protein [Alteribacter lacisalsi]|uniref:Capsular biosynthesis protein n=1 Tax=Alteribacter lacisalsi TaxID=2045244 RepID=A0A2W0HJF5_9BACI|nr:EpsG family protein [Alteribacter lacisalsi]PYZ96949.1 capsular biosynthesis protein [Alteribacter lacisalsi]
MAILYANLAIVFSLSFLSRYSAQTGLDQSLIQPVEIRPNRYFAFFAMLTLVIVSGLRINIGDTYYYRHAFETNVFTLDYALSQKDFGFAILQYVLQQITTDAQILIFVTALITNVLIVAVLYKYSRVFELSLYVYVTSGLFLVSMNGIRQFLAAAIIFTATKYIMDGSWKKFTIVVLIASTFHQSALILIPIYFIVRRPAWTQVTFGILLGGLILVAGYGYFSQVLFSALGDSQYGHYSEFSEGGASILRVLVYGAPLLIAFIGRERLRELFPNGDFIVNLCVLNLLFMIIASQNWIFARLTIYFGLYQLILVAWIVKLFAEKDRKLVYYLILIFYFIFFYYEHVLALNIEYRSNFF